MNDPRLIARVVGNQSRVFGTEFVLYPWRPDRKFHRKLRQLSKLIALLPKSYFLL